VPAPLSIVWLAPPLAPGQGGIRNILRMAGYLARFGHTVRVHVDPCDFGDAAALGAFVARHYGPSPLVYRCGHRDIGACDAVVATFWTTAPSAAAHREARGRFYFVQDYEPAFYPPDSAEHRAAAATYRLGLHHLCSGPWCAKVLRERFSARAEHFAFPLDRRVYFERLRAFYRPHVVFFARPEMPRRRFPLGVAALAEVYRHTPGLVVSLFGSASLPPGSVPFPHRDLGIVPTLERLSRLYANADVGLAFSATNPSLVPLEMMASGCPVVEIDNEITRQSYASGSVRLAADAPAAVAEAVLALLGDPFERARQRAAGLEFAATFPDEEGAARQVEAALLRGLRDA